MGALASFYALGIEDSEAMMALLAVLAPAFDPGDYCGCSLLPTRAGVVVRLLAGNLSRALAFCEAANNAAIECGAPLPAFQAARSW
jgi:hypothetical protein